VSAPTIVCTLGMHRSGTSLVSRVLNVLGLYLGPKEHLMRPSADNPTGHWESRPIKEINDEILSILGGTWSEPPPLPEGWERSPKLAGSRRRAREVIEADFSGSELWGFKDPRNSLTLPFWQRILDPMRYVICLRNPLDAAASARARKDDTVSFERGIQLWLTYVRGALAATAGHPRHFVFYEDLMADPKPTVRELARFIGREKSSGAKADIRSAISVAVTEGLWHHRTAVPDVVDASGLPFHVKAFYLALRQFVPGVETVGAEALDLLGAYAADAGDQQNRLDAAAAELKQASERARILTRRGIALEQRVAERSDELQRAIAERDEERRLRNLHEAELQRLAEERDDERRSREAHEADRQRLAGELDEDRRLRRRLEAELEASRAEVGRLQASAERLRSDAAPAPAEPPRRERDVLVSEVQERVTELIPSGATVLVAGKGDEALLRLDGRTGWHFPMAEDGRYAGFHPAGDTAAIAQLEALRARGADHLLLPATMLWWLDHYEGLRRHLEERYSVLLTDERCAIFKLTGEGGKARGPIATLKGAIASLRIRTGRDPSILDWGSDLGIASQLIEETVFAPPSDEATLPYLDATVDIVVVPAGADAVRLAEARRVAGSAVIRVDAGSERAELEWLAGGGGGWGEDVNVALIPAAGGWPWDAILGSFAEMLNDGFGGEFSATGDPAALGPASERATAAGVPIRPVEAPAGTSLARRARAAAESSDRRLQIFLTAPAIPLPSWLPSILALHAPERGTGVVGARIVSRLGFLEEAGGILAANGMRKRRGAGDANPDRPEYCFVQRVDFCSPPLLATSRDLFDRLGGFEQGPVAPDQALIDFSLRAGKAGAPVYYQPEARVVAIGNGIDE
jgi:hypothetical protein